MKVAAPLIVGIGVLLLLLVTSQDTAAATGALNLSSLIGYNQYATADAVGRLNAIYAELASRGYSTEQILWMLSQILLETGLFTSVANYNRMNQNNYAGLTDGSNYLSFNSIADFCDAYIQFLSKRSNPLGAASLSDFNNRLLTIGPNGSPYYTSSPATYLANLQYYYNLLSQTA